MAQTLHVPVDNFVYKYIKAVFGEPNRAFDHWYLSTHWKEGKFMYALLQHAPCRVERPRKGQTMLDILVPSKMAVRKGSFITPENLELFCEYIKQVIMDEIVSFHTGIESRVGLKAIDKITINQYQADKKVRVLRVVSSEAKKFFWQKSIIHDILARYDITEDEISTDAVVKYLQRYGKIRYSA